MNADDFEQRLRRQPPRQLPPEWREEILRSARAADSRRAPGAGLLSVLSVLSRRVAGLLWPSPKAWGGLAAAWLVILSAQFAVRDRSRPAAQHAAPSTAEVERALNEQQRLLAELLGPPHPRQAERRKAVAPPPRSEIRLKLLGA